MAHLSRSRLRSLRKMYTKLEIEELIKEWGYRNLNNGYAIVDFDGMGLYAIEAIDDVSAFDDVGAVKQAIKDGVKVIPLEELPIDFPDYMRFLGWIDTKENRNSIMKFSEFYCKTVDNKNRM